jgi:hypothetical protein
MATAKKTVKAPAKVAPVKRSAPKPKPEPKVIAKQQTKLLV